MSEPEVHFLGDVQRLTLEPGDVVVLTVKGPISDNIAQRITSLMEARLPGHTALVLEDGMKLGVLARPVTSTVEAKVDHLIALLTDEGEDPPGTSLDGSVLPGERDVSESLDG